MANPVICPDNPFTYEEIAILESTMSYISTGPKTSPTTKTVVFLHGNPTSSYLWRNIIPHISPAAHCIALDLIGMGRSGKPSMPYRFADHARYLSAFLSVVLPSGPITFVLHDWGSALGLDWARRHPERVSGLALMEFIRPLDGWHEFPDNGPRQTFQAFRTPDLGRKLLIEENAFVEKFLPACIVRPLGEVEMRHYREPFREVGSREPLWRWPQELPVDGSPADVCEITQAYHEWLLASEVPKLFFWASPGGLISEEKAMWYVGVLKNSRSVSIGPGIHYLQEDNPHLIGREIAEWVAKL